jgi:hypothetical protein
MDRELFVEFGVDCARLFKVGTSLCLVAKSCVRLGPHLESRCDPRRSQLDDPAKVANSLLVPSKVCEGYAAVVVRVGKLRAQLDAPSKVGNGFVSLVHLNP